MPALGQVAEATVVALAMSGDHPAFTELVRRRQAAVRGLLRRLSRDPALADDLAQVTFIKAWRALPQLRSVAAFGGWLRRLAVNTWLEHRRSNPSGLMRLDDGTPEPTAPPASVDAALDLDRALLQLAPDERLCVVLAYHEGMSHGEISEATRMPLGTVKSHVRRGAERLRGLLAGYPAPEEQIHVG